MKAYIIGCCFALSVLVSGMAESESLEVCGVSIPEIPGFKLTIRVEDNVCYGELVSTMDLNPAVLAEENNFIIEPISFKSRLDTSGRFSRNGSYTYNYSVDETIQQVSEAGKVNLDDSIASGTATLRIKMSPFMLWDSEENINKAQKKFSISKTGLLFDCFYGLVGVGDATATLSACVPRSVDKMDPKITDVKTAFENIKPKRES
ncbi:hypothetical protein [Pseudomonas sp. NFIX28]|uniref:hypothetical protein n=1 Tax=Pseudomonas sp. NFIX28 TaxID=1566235 RepID=UPI00089D694F|nr:hypothetical protein [Pseudomonas sp. NFIX28]SDY62768.1 hypothetical protein SAMN03159453_00989 [Pseudomonas sp. NFIX28]